MYLSSLNALKSHVANMQIKPNEELMILAGEGVSENVEELIKFLNTKSVNFFGGIYPSLLVGNKSYSKGFIVEKYEPVYSSIVLPSLMRFKLDPNEYKNSTAIILIDGLSAKMKELTDTVFNKLSDNFNYIGGGAGFYDLKHRPCIFNNKGIHKDVLHICILKSNIQIAVKHGWNKLEGPFRVTESRGNVLCKLDNYSAFDVYRDVIEDHERITLYKEDFFIYAKDHPFGVIKKATTDFVVRDPIMLNEQNEIVCVADIPEDSEVYVLKGNIDTLLSASLQIAEYCAAKAPEKYSPLLFNCISRAMFMEKRFDEELTNIQNKLKFPIQGAVSIGEIASQENGDLVIHNKSTILGLLSIDT